MRFGNISRKQSQERGQTIALVALTIVTLLAMAALAIDVVTLYVAKGEVQRAADAAALVAAKGFVDSGVTSDPANTSLQTLAENMATAGINAILPQNKVAGAAPVLANAPSFDFTTHPGNPQVTVTLQRTGLPIFFARIWRRAAATVTASAKAEAYNPANSQTATGNFIPITLKDIKPLLIANKDPNNGGNPFIDATTGVVATGETNKVMTLAAGQFLPAIVTVTANSPNLCPSCQGSSDFEQSIECGESQVTKDNSFSCGGTAMNASIATGMTKKDVRNQGRAGLQCLIDEKAPDTIDPATNFPTTPIQIIAGSGPFKGNLISTSRSIANFPIIDTSLAITFPPGDVRIIGFLQGFIESVSNGGPLSISVRILNIAGCGNNPGSTSVQAGGTSAIPVRLISQ